MKPLAVPMGDPAGIGPEVVARAWAMREEADLPPFFAIGDPRALTTAGFTGFEPIGAIGETDAIFPRALPLLPVSSEGGVQPGRPDPDGARGALHALELGVGVVREQAAGALVTGPVSKANFYEIGFTYPGQTEFVAERCGIARDNAAMLLVGGGLRALPVTVHIPLAEVAGALSVDLIVARGRTAARALIRDFGILAPRIAVAGLNPHAGESGALGREDIEVVAPAVAQLCAEGIDARGPFPPDTLFHAAARANYDAVLCMYHDQALIPVKTLAFDSGVNMTLGLPIVRTAPDHGTAFSIAGCGTANPGAMIAAIALAGACARRRLDS